MTEAPDSPPRRVEVEHEDGTVRVLEGEDAQLWVSYVSSALKFTRDHGGRPPDVEWEEVETDDGA